MGMTRVFLLKANEACTSSDFKLNDLPASSGRLDVVCRCIIASLLEAGRIRDDTVFIVVLEGKPDPPVRLKLDGERLQVLSSSEVGIASMIKQALEVRFEKSQQHTVPNWLGVSIEKKSFTETLDSELTSGELYYLHEKGEDIRNVDIDLAKDNIFVLGGNKGLSAEDEKPLDCHNAKRISVGPLSYLSSQVITLVQEELDRRKTKRA
jgi:tRNA (pseudouridine54-N1)-methyltransferase